MTKKITRILNITLFILTLLIGVSGYNQAQAQVPGSFDDGPQGDWCGGIKCPNDYCGEYQGYAGGYFKDYPCNIVCKNESYYEFDICSLNLLNPPDPVTTCDWVYDPFQPYNQPIWTCTTTTDYSSGFVDSLANTFCSEGSVCQSYCPGDVGFEPPADGVQSCFENWGTWWCCDTPDPSPTPTDAPLALADDGGPDCSGFTADVDANGSDLDLTTYDDYTISWTSTEADNCTLNSDSVSTSGSQVFAASVNGTYPYDLLCTNATCAEADSVDVTVNLCGNGTCSGFENCSSCSVDCTVCSTAWWQVSGGNLFSSITGGNAISSKIADSLTCIEPNCVPGLSILDRAGTTNSDGFPITGGGAIDSNGQKITYRSPDVFAIGTTTTRLFETYSYFYSKFSLGISPFDDYSGSSGDALEPATSKEAYFHSGNMTIQSPWDVTAGESYVIFVAGDLTIEDPVGVGELIRVDEGGFLAFIVSGNITIADSVGHSVLSNSVGNIEGVFVADGVINIASNGVDDKKFIGEGTFTGWAGVGLSRAYGDLVNNDLYPAETFIYRPDFVKNVPEKMMRSQMLWQETN